MPGSTAHDRYRGAHPLVEQVQATLRRLADAPQAAEAAKAFSIEIDGLWNQPLSVGIGGTLPARTELFNTLSDVQLFDPMARAPGCAALRIRAGAETMYRTLHDDGTHEEYTMPPDAPPHTDSRERSEAIALELAERERAVARLAIALPARPPVWALWRWPGYWLRRARATRQRAERDRAMLALEDSRAKLVAITGDTPEVATHARLARQRYIESLRSSSGGGPIANGILQVELTLANSPLPERVEVVELAGITRASAVIDAVFMAASGRLFAPVRGGSPLPVGDSASVIPNLPRILADARALRIAHRVHRKITAVMASLRDAIERKESAFRARIDKLQALRITDPQSFAHAQLDRVRGEISTSVHAVVEHASVHLGSELAQLHQAWIGSIANAPDTDALKAAVAKVEADWHAEPRRIAEETRVLMMGGLGGAARDIYPSAAGVLDEHGLPAERTRIKAAPELPPIVFVPSLTKQTAKLEKTSWFAGLFRSFDTKRKEVHDKVFERLERMREVAGVELLDAEPRLHHAIGGALADLLARAMADQQAWLDKALDDERAAIERERQAIYPLVRVHDAVRLEANRLGDMIAQLEAKDPALAVAVAAAETASLSG